MVHSLKDPESKSAPSRQIQTHGKPIDLHQTESYPAAKEISEFVQFTIMPSTDTLVLLFLLTLWDHQVITRITH